MIPPPKLTWKEVEDRHKCLLNLTTVRYYEELYRNRGSMPVNVIIQRRVEPNLRTAANHQDWLVLHREE